jgi:hypothetical protein
MNSPAPEFSAADSEFGAHFLVDEKATNFATHFNLNSFGFNHRLAQHPLFELPRLIELAKRVAKHPRARPDEVYFDAGDVHINQRWSDIARVEMSATEALERIQTAGAWMLIRRAELCDEYRVLLDECLREVQRLVRRDLDAVMCVKNAIVFISSPNRITPYHIDRECNFLLQVSGTKTISIFDRSDRSVLTEHELERYWAVDNNAALYKPHLQDRARVYPLQPGQGVHIPVNCPHWVQNGPEPSVSLSVNFEFAGRERSDVYRANYYLRQLGLQPKPPGTSDLSDRLKRSWFLPPVQRAHRFRAALRTKLQRVRETGVRVSQQLERFAR